MLKFLIYLGFLVAVVLSLPGCNPVGGPSTIIEEKGKGEIVWDFGDNRYIIDVMAEPLTLGGVDTCFYTGNSFYLPEGRYWIGVEPDCDLGVWYHSFIIELKEGDVFDVGEKVRALEALL